MKTTIKSFFYALLFSPATSFAQWHDSFDDAEFRTQPAWEGDTAHFIVNSEFQLQLNAPATGSRSFLATRSDISSGSWGFRIRLDFNPSSGNYARVYLTSDQARLDTSLNGYFVRVGGTGDDICLFRQDGLQTMLIIDGKDGLLNRSVNDIAILVSRDAKNNWKISGDSTGKANYFEIGSALDSACQYSRYFGIQCFYSSTRTTRFFFDDFQVDGKKSNDALPPFVRKVDIPDDSTVSIGFSEPLDPLTLKDINVMGTVQVKDERTVMVFPAQKIACRQPLDISLKGISDMAGNRMVDTTLLISYCPGIEHDVLITEIMADPDPPVRLPNMEYIELFNRSGNTLNLEKWSLLLGDDKIIFPSLDFPQDSFLLVCAPGGCNHFTAGKLCIDGLPVNGLNNSGEYIGLRNRGDELIHRVDYDPSFYRDALKNTGGWSLEMVDIDHPCAGRENWKASTDYRGGSPMRPNSVKGTVTEQSIFRYLHVYLPADSVIRVYFSKPVQTKNVSNSWFQLEPGAKIPVRVKPDSLRHQYLDLVFPRPFQGGTLYSLPLSGEITDCSGARLNESAVIVFMKPTEPAAGDILINEILFDALPGKQEFVEFYNASDHYIRSSDLKLSYHGPADTYKSVLSFSDEPFVIAPHTFTVIAGKEDESYPDAIPHMETLITSKDLPVFHNEEGCIRLMNQSMEVLDQFCYSAKMHYNLLGSKAGVSLERVRYGAPTGDPENWHSASSTSGYATPGEVNSQFLEEPDPEKEITIENEIFSPDNDGYKDIETISYKLDKPGFAASILIFDAHGRKVRTIINNQTLSTSGSFTWDGIDDSGHLAGTGIYLVYIEMQHPSGEVKRYKKTCVVGGGRR